MSVCFAETAAFAQCPVFVGFNASFQTYDVAAGSSVGTDLIIDNDGTVTCNYGWSIEQLNAGQDRIPQVQVVPGSGLVTIGPHGSVIIPITITAPAVTPAFGPAIIKARAFNPPASHETTAYINVIPSGEATASNGWDIENPTIHKWKQTLSPSGADFSGRYVVEGDPGGGGPDTCHFPGSAHAPAESITGGSWFVNSDNEWFDDLVGWGPLAVQYYRIYNRAPCGTRFPQAMAINCSPFPFCEYQRNWLAAGFDENSVYSERDGIRVTRSWASTGFFDPNLVRSVTPVRAIHVFDLRMRINEARASVALAAATWTDPDLVAGVTPVKAIHIVELRNAISQAHIASHLPPPVFARTIEAGSVIAAEDIQELRNLVSAIEDVMYSRSALRK